VQDISLLRCNHGKAPVAVSQPVEKYLSAGHTQIWETVENVDVHFHSIFPPILRISAM